MEIEEGPAIVRKGLPTRVRRGFRLLAVTATLCCVFVTVYSQWCLDKDLGVNDGGLILVGLVQYRTALASSVVNSIFILSQLMPEGKTPKVLEATLKVKEGVAAASGTLQVVISIIAFIRSGSSYSILSLRFEAMQSIYRVSNQLEKKRTNYLYPSLADQGIRTRGEDNRHNSDGNGVLRDYRTFLLGTIHGGPSRELLQETSKPRGIRSRTRWPSQQHRHHKRVYEQVRRAVQWIPGEDHKFMSVLRLFCSYSLCFVYSGVVLLCMILLSPFYKYLTTCITHSYQVLGIITCYSQG